MKVFVPTGIREWIEQEAARIDMDAAEILRILITQTVLRLQKYDLGVFDDIGVLTPDQRGSAPKKNFESKTSAIAPNTRNRSDEILSKQEQTEKPEQVNEDRPRFKGVYRYGKRWAAWGRNPNTKKRYRLGVFDTPEEAARVYDEHLVTRAGGYDEAAVNFPRVPMSDREALSQAYVEKFAFGTMTPEEMKAWERMEPMPGSKQPLLEAVEVSPAEMSARQAARQAFIAEADKVERYKKPLPPPQTIYRRPSGDVSIADGNDDDYDGF